ncbi:hypothetical protein ABE571_02945 [Stenotrophomonas sp. TWI273]|jgi:hypothetical protein|uniref:hypothetical protein n=1 Tax=unclassified Stenotrophomonas TaxID=196198 RepID=UPI000E916DCF|nr:hypothetical protein [Stenotrophomonas sp.]HAU80953.1 hypothetical protein [Stenotrophomonas sp.]
MDLLISMLTMVGVRLPVLIALAIAVVWVVDTPRGAIRSVALAALGVMALTTLAGLVLNLVPMWMVQQGNYENLQLMSKLLGAGHFALNLFEALALVLLVWAMTRALRGRAVPPTAPLPPR